MPEVKRAKTIPLVRHLRRSTRGTFSQTTAVQPAAPLSTVSAAQILPKKRNFTLFLKFCPTLKVNMQGHILKAHHHAYPGS
jgi:hypothetical protein